MINGLVLNTRWRICLPMFNVIGSAAQLQSVTANVSRIVSASVITTVSQHAGCLGLVIEVGARDIFKLHKLNIKPPSRMSHCRRRSYFIVTILEVHVLGFRYWAFHDWKKVYVYDQWGRFKGKRSAWSTL